MRRPAHIASTQHELVFVDRSGDAKRNQALRVAVGKTTKKNAVDNAEDSCCGANSDGQGNDYYGGEERRTAKASDGVTDVVKLGFEPGAGGGPIHNSG